MKAELDQGAIAVAHAVAGEKDRPVLTCVRIGNGEIVAANGYIMVRHPVKIEGEGEILVRGSAIMEARAICPHGNLLLEQSGDEVILKSADPNQALMVRTTVVNAHFPTFERTYPTSEPTFIALAPPLLRKLLNSILDDISLIKFRVRGPHDPVEFIAGEATGLIMPMYVLEEDELWHKVEKVKLV